MNPNTIKVIAVVFISLLFLTSAFDKILNFGSTVQNHLERINTTFLSGFVNQKAAEVSIILAILMLIIGPMLMTIGVYTENMSLIKIGAGLLIFFLIFATLLYHPIFDAIQRPQFFKNLAIIGSLMLLLVQC
jgi:uncharacterized membrane protein YphA (DoxX/SURF4 family)